MKRIIFMAVLAASLILSGCINPQGPKPGNGIPQKINVAGAKGLFLHAGSATKSARDIVTSSGASLGAVDASGIPSSVSFLDSGGNSVTATILKALQLSSAYVLLTYDVSGTSTTAALNLSSGALASLAVNPDNWANIYTLGSSIWFEAAGNIYKASLDTGAESVLSASSGTWHSNGSPVDNTGPTASVAWASDTWIYVDAGQNVYAMRASNTQDIHAQAIKADGTIVEFGQSQAVLPVLAAVGNGSQGFTTQAITDPATGKIYAGWATDEHDGNPAGANGFTITGRAFKVWPITFNVDADPILTFDSSQLPVTGVHITDGTGNTLDAGVEVSHIGTGLAAPNVIFANGPETIRPSFSSGNLTLTVYNTSAVPRGGFYGHPVNWTYSTGQLYAGPVSDQVIRHASLANPSTTQALVTGNGTISTWAVVAETLFWSDGSGTWQAPIIANSSAVGTVKPWTGGVVTAITE